MRTENKAAATPSFTLREVGADDKNAVLRANGVLRQAIAGASLVTGHVLHARVFPMIRSEFRHWPDAYGAVVRGLVSLGKQPGMPVDEEALRFIDAMADTFESPSAKSLADIKAWIANTSEGFRPTLLDRGLHAMVIALPPEEQTMLLNEVARDLRPHDFERLAHCAPGIRLEMSSFEALMERLRADAPTFKGSELKRGLRHGWIAQAAFRCLSRDDQAHVTRAAMRAPTPIWPDYALACRVPHDVGLLERFLNGFVRGDDVPKVGSFFDGDSL